MIKYAQLAVSFNRLNIKSEFDGVSGWSRSQIVLPSFETQLPGMEMRGSKLVERWLCHVNVEALRLADEGRSCSSQVDQLLLRDLPNSLVQVLKVLRYLFDFLDASIISD